MARAPLETDQYLRSCRRDGEFNFVMAVAIAEDGAVYVVDFGNNRIQKWRPKPN